MLLALIDSNALIHSARFSAHQVLFVQQNILQQSLALRSAQVPGGELGRQPGARLSAVQQARAH